MQDFEKLGAFYLGKSYDLAAGAVRDELLLYDSKDLTTHAVCLGMTGSGKTGLCLSLLEEAAIDGVPAIAIDPKGDLGNLLLTFPDLKPADFRPWVDASAATRQGMTVEESATKTASMWRSGLASWGQDGERIRRFQDAVDIAIYTPGSNAGLPLTVLRSFAAPTEAVREDTDAFRECVASATSGLLALLGVDADPIRSREHILVSNLLAHAWKEGRDLDIPSLIREIQSPPFDQVGIMDLESFFPANDRIALSMTLNNLLASPSFASWMEGESLDVKKLLYTDTGKPRLSILSIAHLSEAERMFFVTILLNEVVSWVRSQPGTSSLRALLYMDEVYGYLPPVAQPPSKRPLLTLLKQARAHGLGVVLATQNPGDLDYKALANTGTWFLGRLQAERDKAKVLEGLEGASVQAGANFDRQKMEAILAGLKSRVFLMNNVHEDEPTVFQTRWALSYLRGPITRKQIQTLMASRKAERAEDDRTARASADPTSIGEVAEPVVASSASSSPMVPPDVEVAYLPCGHRVPDGCRLVYRPALLGRGRLHFARATYKIDVWQRRTVLQPIGAEVPDPVWEGATVVDPEQLNLQSAPDPNAEFAALPAALSHGKSYATWQKALKGFFYRSATLTTWKCALLKEMSEAGESEGEFRSRLAHVAREQRDLQVEKMRRSYGKKLATLKRRLQAAEAAVGREKSQANRAAIDTAISFGSTLLGALFGRKLASSTNVTRASTSMRSAGRAAQQRGDIARAKEKFEETNRQLKDLESQFQADLERLESAFTAEAIELEERSLRPRKSDIEVGGVAVVWTPWQLDATGIAEPLYRN